MSSRNFNKIKVLTALVMVSVFVFSLTGCGSSSNNDKTTSSQTSQASSTAEPVKPVIIKMIVCSVLYSKIIELIRKG